MNMCSLLCGGTLDKPRVKIAERIDRSGVDENEMPTTVKLLGPGRVYVYLDMKGGNNAASLTFDTPHAALEYFTGIIDQINERTTELEKIVANQS